jgi:hypothetical protein
MGEVGEPLHGVLEVRLHARQLSLELGDALPHAAHLLARGSGIPAGLHHFADLPGALVAGLLQALHLHQQRAAAGVEIAYGEEGVGLAALSQPLRHQGVLLAHQVEVEHRGGGL